MTYTDYGNEESIVSLEDLEAYLANATRPILEPLVQGQAKVTAPFTAGSSGVPPTNVDETGTPDGSPSAPHALPVTDDDEIEDDDTDVGGVEEEGADGGVPEPEAPAPAPSPTADDDTIEVSPGVFMTREAIAAAVARTQQPAQFPAGGDGSAAGVPTSTPAAPPAPVEPAPPIIPQALLDDPELAPLVHAIQSQQTTLDEQRVALTQLHDITISREQEALQARVVAGINRFRADKSLSEEQITQVNTVAANLNVMPSLASGIDPLTGEAVPRDPETAAYRALEIAYWQMPEYREAEVNRQVAARAKDSRRKQRLAGVSGGNGSVPRTRTVPTDRRSRELAAVADLREMMNPGQGEE